jgi:hypothetical protein
LLTIEIVVGTNEVMAAGVRKELAWMEQFGCSRFPFDRHRREFLDYQKTSADKHIKHLEMYLEISPHLIPKTQSLLRPTIRHPDLQPHNIFVSDEFKVVGLIDWQHCSVLPLFLQAGVPKYWQNTSDEPAIITKPTLPTNFEQLNEAEKAQVMQEYHQRQLHLLHLGGTTRFNPKHMDVYLIKGLAFKRRIFEHASAPWEGDNITLKADLILATQNWKRLTASKESEEDLSEGSMVGPVCPIVFSKEEAGECLRLDLLLKGVDSDMVGVRENIGISSDGWVPNEEYQGAVERNKYIRQQVIDQAEDDEARDLSLRHYPFDDHSEDE